MMDIEQIERRLWSSADNLRANSNLAANEYFLPIMGLIFLRHAYSRFLKIQGEIVTTLPSRAGKRREPIIDDFTQRSALYLQKQAQFPHLVALPSEKDRAQAIVEAMESIETDYESLKGVLPKREYQELDNNVLGSLLRTFNDPALESASGDVFGRIYEYFLTEFAGLKAHDGGEFFTPQSLVQMIVNVIEPVSGKVLDPACGSGGMFVQSAHFIESRKENPLEKVVFYGMEKNPTTIRLAKMNLAVHGLEGNIRKAISYYEDPHELIGKVNYVMANPPFNVDEVDGDKIKNDPRLPFGLPGVNKKERISNGNYLWISYFYSYLNERGRSGFVMSSQASSAGNKEVDVRRKLVETGHVDCMMSIRGGFFYTRTVPCELWFFDKAKPQNSTVLMIDARAIYRKVTRVIYDFSPEQQKNLTAIVWLSREQHDRFSALINEYLNKTREAARAGATALGEFQAPLTAAAKPLKAFLSKQKLSGEHRAQLRKLRESLKTLPETAAAFQQRVTTLGAKKRSASTSKKLAALAETWKPLAGQSRDIAKFIDHLHRLIEKNLETADGTYNARKHETWDSRKIRNNVKALNEGRKALVESLNLVHYFHRQAQWLLERFPAGVYCDVEGLCKRVDISEIKKNDWSLTPGRYVGVAPEEEDEDPNFEKTMREIHTELQNLNAESVVLAAKVQQNFEDLEM
ncbi:MAG: N-6 DNA methylase [Salinispira sp.]